MSVRERDATHGLQLLQTGIHSPPRLPTRAAPPAPSPRPSSLSNLLNPAPPGASPLPAGFVLGKDGKIKKKRGRKPTPGLTDEDRRQVRLLKNRRTAETSRRRKLAMLNQLTAERDHAKGIAHLLTTHNDLLTRRLAAAHGKSVHQLLKEDPALAPPSLTPTRPGSTPEHSDVSRTTSCAGSESDTSPKKR